MHTLPQHGPRRPSPVGKNTGPSTANRCRTRRAEWFECIRRYRFSASGADTRTKTKLRAHLGHKGDSIVHMIWRGGVQRIIPLHYYTTCFAKSKVSHCSFIGVELLGYSYNAAASETSVYLVQGMVVWRWWAHGGIICYGARCCSVRSRLLPLNLLLACGGVVVGCRGTALNTRESQVRSVSYSPIWSSCGWLLVRL